jgi:hypothetical protein
MPERQWSVPLSDIAVDDAILAAAGVQRHRGPASGRRRVRLRAR